MPPYHITLVGNQHILVSPVEAEGGPRRSPGRPARERHREVHLGKAQVAAPGALMAKKRTLACRDLGMNCKFKVTAKNDQKIEAKIAKHLKKKHKMLEMPHDLQQRVQSMIRDSV